ncbi:MAG: hypothetical protein JWN72_299 [Thermoleophilia bacterium]|nr:hypothetical protein [Thermoleophilia bacterium]
MSAPSWIGLYGIAFAVFMAIDLFWLGIVAKPLYKHFLGDLMLEQVRWPAAVLFYALWVVGLVYFAIGPVVTDHATWTLALRHGALYGFFTYATFDLTCRAVLKGYPLGIVPIDMAWGTILAGATASLATVLWRVIT